MYKYIAFAAVLAYANAGLIGAPAYATSYAAPVAVAHGIPAVSAAIGSSQQSTLRSWDGSNVVSQYSKAVDTAFSSVRKYDTRITNDARILAPAVATYAHAAPVVAHGYAAPAIAHGYAAPAIAHGYAASPVLAARTIAAPVAAHAGLLGVAYSAAPAVSHISYDGLNAHYAW